MSECDAASDAELPLVLQAAREAHAANTALANTAPPQQQSVAVEAAAAVAISSAVEGAAVEVEVEAPAGERRVYSEAGYYAQAVYTPEQQAPGPNPTRSPTHSP